MPDPLAELQLGRAWPDPYDEQLTISSRAHSGALRA